MKKFFYKFLFLIPFLGFIGCENSIDLPSNEIQLARTPDVVAYSGEQVLGSTINLPSLYTNAGDGYIGNQNWQNKGAESLENITDEERNAVLDAIKSKVTGERISEDLVFPWTEYFLQDVITMEDGNYTNAGNNGMKDVSVNILEAFSKGSKCDQRYYPAYDFEDYETVTNSKKLNTYFQKQTANGQERINQTVLMTDMTVGTYEEMRGHQFRVWINCHINDHYYDYIIVNVNESYYICFDFGCGTEAHDKDGDPGRGATFNDWDYNDWILKITPAGNQPDVWGEEDLDSGYTSNEPKDITEHVETNLSIEEHSDIKGLIAHLSIHVRAVTDVEIFIPVPKEYYCNTDDMAIVQKHKEDFIIHGGPTVTEYDINGTTVTLTVNFEENGIRITTDGINEDVIAYLQEKFEDGITFEVWNYFNESIDRETLKSYLDDSTIEFLDKNPDLYVNAFVDLGNDCVVDIIDSQRIHYDDSITGTHYNNSSYNQLYYIKEN